MISQTQRAINALKTRAMVDAILHEASDDRVGDVQVGDAKLMFVVSNIIPKVQDHLRGDAPVCDFVAAELVSLTKELVQSVFNERLSTNAKRVAEAILA